MSCQSKYAKLASARAEVIWAVFFPLSHQCPGNRGSHALFPQMMCQPVFRLLKISQDCVKGDAQPLTHFFQRQWCVLNEVKGFGVKTMNTNLLKAVECQSVELDASLPACATCLLYISKFLQQILHHSH